MNPTSVSIADVISRRWGELTQSERQSWEEAFVYGAGMRVELFNELLFFVDQAPISRRGHHPVLSVILELVKEEVSRAPRSEYA